MPQKFLSIKNFEKYQSKGTAGRPWIKLHKTILGDPEFMKLSSHHRFLYTGLLLLADDCGNRIYNDRTYIGQRLYMSPTEIDLKPLYRAGFLYTSNLARTLSEESREELDIEENRIEEKEKSSVSVVPTKRRTRAVEVPKSSETWESYRTAYELRYGAVPVRNASVNGILSRLVDRLGADVAPAVAAFYVQHNKPFYVEKRHPVNLLLADAEGLHTQWVTGIKATTGEAKNAEKRDDAQAQIARVKAAMGEV